MRQSLSARIFLGFLVVVLAFGGVLGFTVYRMQRVRVQLELIKTRYLRLALILGELHTVQGNLLNTIAERAAGRGTSKFLRRQVALARQWRLLDAKKALELIGTSETRDLSTRDRQLSERSRARLTALAVAFRRHELDFDRLFGDASSPPRRLEQIGEALLREERKALTTIRKLGRELRARVQSAAGQVEADQRASILAGLALIVLALALSGLVTLRMRKLLRPLGTLVDGTKRIASGDYSGRVDVASGDELGLLAGEFNKMAEAVEEREQRLIRSERLAAAGRLASHITHEVRNPLNSISLNTELLEEELAELPDHSRDEAQSILRSVQKEVDRLTDITEEYLQFARLPKPSLAEEDLDELVGSLLDFMRGELEVKGVRIERVLAGDLPLVPVDENQLRQALLNLVRNAGEAMAPAGGGQLRVCTQQLADTIQILVGDTGSGIEPEALRQVFDPFFSTKDGGTGLGLALTQQIVHEHGGTISVDSRPGEGTTFVVSLPVPGTRDKVDAR